MHIVVIHGWMEVTAQLVQTLANVLELTAFDARQRLAGSGPAVVAAFADAQAAHILLAKLQQKGFAAFVIDAAGARHGSPFVVRRFGLAEEALHLETADGSSDRIGYREVRLLLPASRIARHTEIQETTERKFSMGKTLMAGGIPMTSKVTRQETVSSEEREMLLYLCAENRPRILCARNGMAYDGLGAAMKPSREMNFNFLVAELRRRCPDAGYDDRLLRRQEQVKLLGPLLSPESNLDLAVEILARTAGIRD